MMEYRICPQCHKALCKCAPEATDGARLIEQELRANGLDGAYRDLLAERQRLLDLGVHPDWLPMPQSGVDVGALIGVLIGYALAQSFSGDNPYREPSAAGRISREAVWFDFGIETMTFRHGVRLREAQVEFYGSGSVLTYHCNGTGIWNIEAYSYQMI
jgi:hypothetical protein